ncbi:nucleoside permease [Candidatus Tokpelaia sp.]|uniref:nucleoside permease n=1 Tax=Candidatus Tokpelaia sp. TaxID=2233777 RepID=UPI00123AC350|nr:nucleoside permease [Candidatus Tokpelaia sp.]KAA6405961.1 MFS transporter [Candidatus Tokpelaia sp.]
MTIQARLKIMSFLQFFIWGSWLITLGSYMIKTLAFSGTQVGNIYSMQGIAACIMPLLLGIIADKYIAANRLYALCHLSGGVILLIMAQITNAETMIWVMLLNLMAYMPSLGLANAIAHFCLKQKQLDTAVHFPSIRVFGTIGFIAAMWIISLSGNELSPVQLYIAAAASFCLALYSLTLPSQPAAAAQVRGGLDRPACGGAPRQRGGLEALTCGGALQQKGDSGRPAATENWAHRLGLEALVLLKQPRLAVFFAFAMLLGVVLHITNTFGNPFLHDLAARPEAAGNVLLRYPDILYSLSQISEIAFILTIPFFLKKFGIKIVMAVSVSAWILRFVFFAFGGASSFGMSLLVLSMLVYGCAFDFFSISGSIFIEKVVDSSMRSGAQGLFMTAVNGFGTFIGMYLGGRIIDYFTDETGRNWQAVWLVFAAYSAVLLVLFLVIFRAKEPAAAATGPHNV